MSLSAATEAYQASLEHLRAARGEADPEMVDELEEDVARARAEMEVAWLNEATAR